MISRPDQRNGSRAFVPSAGRLFRLPEPEVYRPGAGLFSVWYYAPHLVAHIIGDQQRPSPVDGHANRSPHRFPIGIQEPGQDILRLTGGDSPLEGHKDDLVARARLTVL